MPRTPLHDLLRRAAASAHDASTHDRDVSELLDATAHARLTRRHFLGASLGAVAAMSLAACASYADSPPAPDANVAIVGGGLAGLVCAHRLKRAGVSATVFEASNRTGGRTFTARNMLPEGVTTELGGEFIDTSHET